MNLVSVEQLSYAEFLEGLPSPTCLVSMGLRPYDGNAVRFLVRVKELIEDPGALLVES